LRKQNGITLIEILFSIGILGFITLITMNQLFFLQKQKIQIFKRADVISTEVLIQNTLLKKTDIDCQIRGKVFDASQLNVSKIELDVIKTGCHATSSILIHTDSIVGEEDTLVERIFIDGISPTGNLEEYNGRLNIAPKLANSDQKMNIAPLLIRFHTDPNSPPSSKIVLGSGSAPLSIPSGISVSANDTFCQLNWNSSSGARPIRYIIKQSILSGQTSTSGLVTCSPFATVNACSASNLTNGITYFFAIQAENNYESTSFSYEVSCTPFRIPDPPENLAAVASDKTCFINWQASANGTPIIEYSVYQSKKENETQSGPIVCKTKNTNCTISGLTNNELYFFSIRASNPYSPGQFSNSEVSCEPVESE